MSNPTNLLKIDIEISERDLNQALFVIRSLTFSQIQTTAPKWNVDEAYDLQASLRQLRNQLELKLGAIELARELFEENIDG